MARKPTATEPERLKQTHPNPTCSSPGDMIDQLDELERGNYSVLDYAAW
jgi:hypothetical protein